MTSDRVTALQFPSHQAGREGWSGLERRQELTRWLGVVRDPQATAILDDAVRGSLNRLAAHLQCMVDDMADHQRDLLRHVNSCEQRLEFDRQALKRAEVDRARVDALAAKFRAELDTARAAHGDLVARLAALEGERQYLMTQVAGLHHEVVNLNEQVTVMASERDVAYSALHAVGVSRTWRFRTFLVNRTPLRAFVRRVRESGP